MIPLPRFSDGPAHEAGPEIGATPLVQTIGLSKAFGTTTVVEGVSLSIARNEFFTLLGPSGCGKTTLLRLIAGFETPTAGRILLEGTDQIGLPPNRRPVNTVFQSYALFPHLTVEENVAFGLQRQRVPAAETRARVAEALALVRLSDFASRKPAELSGGQQQRVALARAIAPRPLLLLLDEPLSALDLKLRRGMQAELKRLQRDTGITFVLVTHDQGEALSMSDRIAVINAGRVLQVGTPQDIYDRPLTRFVADFIGEANVLPGALVGSATAHVAIRPEHVLLDRAPSANTPHAATILDVTYGGSEITLNLRLDRGEAVTVALREMRPFLSPGAAVHCGFPPERLRDLED